MEEAIRLVAMLHALMFTLSGVPVLYSGDEIAQENDYGYHDDPLKADDSRYLHRGDMDWDAAARRHMPGTVEQRVFDSLRQLETLRAAHRVFDGGADVWIVNTRNDSVLGIGRYFKGEKLVALFNFAADERTVNVDELGEYEDLLSGEPADKWHVTLPSGGFVWLLCDFDKPAES